MCQIHRDTNDLVGMDEHRQIHQRLYDYLFFCTIGGAKVCARAKADQPPLTAVILLGFFQPLGSSLPQKERPEPSKGFSLIGRLLGLSSDIVHNYNLAIRKNHWGIHDSSSKRV